MLMKQSSPCTVQALVLDFAFVVGLCWLRRAWFSHSLWQLAGFGREAGPTPRKHSPPLISKAAWRHQNWVPAF